MKKLFALLLCCTIFICIASAQNFSISWHRIAGGGGTSSGGNYSLTGTIGQHDAGTMTGGDYSLQGGFISGLVLVQTPGAPQLSIQLSGTDAVISWSAEGSADFVLEEATTLASPASWSLSGATVTLDGNTKRVTVSATAIKFYRLRKP